MELVKPKEPLAFKYKDVTFMVKAQAVDSDRLEFLSAGQIDGRRMTIPAAEFRRALIRSMVIDWRGVTLDGKPVPYSFETFMTLFPRHEHKGRSVIEDLCGFIIEKTDLFHKDELEKNASPAQSTGSAE